MIEMASSHISAVELAVGKGKEAEEEEDNNHLYTVLHFYIKYCVKGRRQRRKRRRRRRRKMSTISIQ